MKAGLPPCCSSSVRMSGVLGQRLGRKYSRTELCVRSVKYFVNSHLVSRQAKYVYDCENPALASRYITFGLVNASARKSTSEYFCRTPEIKNSQNGSGFVCGLSTRKIRTPCSLQNSKKLLREAFIRCGSNKSSGHRCRKFLKSTCAP